ncbi:hypothetical protein CEQ90_02915 [Lewinellaceae bacterium SD302]|nr:hypothetical protein CEQ90_02915 [Lewinellaceae bacterium SD302]
MQRLLLSAFALFLLSPSLHAQLGGISAYEFLNLPNSATIAAMGGHHIALRNEDLSLAARNPSLLNPLMHNRIAVSHAFHPAGISNSYLGYSRDRPDLKMTFQAGLQYANYGDDLIRRDVTGQAMGTFNANDFALTVGAARRIENRLTVGLNLKLVSSQLAEYSSVGLASDLALHYRDSTGRLGISILARNIGLQFGQYDPISGREPLPFELQVGVTRELEHLPFRFSIIYRYLDRWNVLYDDPNSVETSLLIGFEEDTERSAGAIWFDNFFRHFVFNGELMVGKKRNLRLRFGYNHGVRKELSLTDYRSLAGYSGGFMFRAGRFSIAYGRTVYHVGGGINQLGLDLQLGKR